MMMNYGSGSGPAGLLLLLLLLVLAVVAGIVLFRMGVWQDRGLRGRRGRGGVAAPGSGVAAAGKGTALPAAGRDPMVILRERLVNGEIELPEFEQRLEALLRSDPAEQMPWWNQALGADSHRN